jgi:beta-xylosidase
VKIVNRGTLCTFSVSGDGREWRVLASDVDLSAMHHNTHGGFYALRPALVSIGGGAARFRNFTYTADRSNE